MLASATFLVAFLLGAQHASWQDSVTRQLCCVLSCMSCIQTMVGGVLKIWIADAFLGKLNCPFSTM